MVTDIQLGLIAQHPNTVGILQELLNNLVNKGRYKEINFSINPIVSVTPKITDDMVYFEIRLVYQLVDGDPTTTHVVKLVNEDTMNELVFITLKDLVEVIDSDIDQVEKEFTEDEFQLSGLLSGSDENIVGTDHEMLLTDDGVLYGSSFKLLITETNEVKTIYHIAADHIGKARELPANAVTLKEDTMSSIFMC